MEADLDGRVGLVRLMGCVKNYDWGRPGKESRVARLYASNSGDYVHQEKPYAEFWMGTHDSGPSYVVLENGLANGGGERNKLTLKNWIENNPTVLGEKVVNKWGTNLPFLFKVLSVAKALSIQAHPDKDLASRLHSELPDVYKDDNHKPEMALALTEFEALCGFITLEARELTEKEQVVLRLEKQYPADVGVLAAFLLNYVKLNPGEALYLGANEPHAYMYGDCIECMATSDNVVRAGLTPKHRDVKTLCSMLTYRQGFPEILPGTAVNPHVIRYIPPFDEFEVDRCILPEQSTAEFPAIPGPSLFMVMEGVGTVTTSSNELVCEGDVFFAPANTNITVSTSSGLHLYRTGVNSRFFEE